MIFAVLAMAIAGNENISLKPILLGSYVNFLHIRPAASGYLVGLEATATSLATAAVGILLQRLSANWMVLMSLLLIAIGNFAAIGSGSFLPLALARVIAGSGHGLAQGLTAASIATSKQPERLTGVITVAMTPPVAAMMLGIPRLQGVYGISPLYIVMLLFAIPAFLLRKRLALPRVALFPSGGGLRASKLDRIVVGVSLFSVACFYLSVGMFWPFAAELGREAGFTYAAAATVTAFATLAATAGALIAVALGNRVGRLGPMAAAICGAIASQIMLLVGTETHIAFAAAVVVYMLCWGTLCPFLIGFSSELDRGGRLNGLFYSLGLAGFAVGPNLGGAILSLGSGSGSGSGAGGANFHALLWLSIVSLGCSFGILYAVRRYEAFAPSVKVWT